MYFDNENITAEESNLLKEAIESILANGEDVLKTLIRQDNISIDTISQVSESVFKMMSNNFSTICYLFEKIGSIDEEKNDEYQFWKRRLKND